MHTADGINIPQSYTSYLAPCLSAKLYNEVYMRVFTYS
jgi:hypothetical protein